MKYAQETTVSVEKSGGKMKDTEEMIRSLESLAIGRLLAEIPPGNLSGMLVLLSTMLAKEILKEMRAAE